VEEVSARPPPAGKCGIAEFEEAPQRELASIEILKPLLEYGDFG